MKGQHIPLVVVALLLLVLYVVTLVFLWRCRHISPLQQPRTQSSTQQQQHASIIITGGGLLTVLAFTFHFLLTNWYLLAPLFTDSLSSSTRCTSWLWVLSLAWPIWTLAILSRAVYYWLAWEGQRGMVKEAEWRRRTRAMQHVASSNSNGGAPRRSTAVSDDGTLTSSASISPYRSIYSTSVTSNGLTCVKSYGHGEMTSDPNIHSMLNNDTLPSQKHHEASNGNTYTTPPIDGTEETEEQSFSDSNTDLEGQRKHAIQMELIHQWLQPSRLPLFVITISVVLMLGLSLPLQSTLDTSVSQQATIECMSSLKWRTIPIYGVTFIIWLVGGVCVYWLLRRLPRDLLTFSSTEWLFSVIISCLQLIIAMTIDVISTEGYLNSFQLHPLLLILIACHIICLFLVFLLLILRPVLLLSGKWPPVPPPPVFPAPPVTNTAPQLTFSTTKPKKSSATARESSSHLNVASSDDTGRMSSGHATVSTSSTTGTSSQLSQPSDGKSSRPITIGERARRSTHATIYSIASALSFTSQNTSATIATMAPPTPYQKFLTMLDDRRQLAQFREFAAKNFCVEHVLFYEHCHRLYRLLTSPDGVSAQLLIEETREIVYLFLQPEAIYEINLSSRVRQSLKQASRQGKLGIRELEEAKDEVARILYQHTYPRYLRWRKDEMETDDIDTDTLVNGRQQHRPASPPPLPSSIRGLSSPSMLLPIVTVEKVNV